LRTAIPGATKAEALLNHEIRDVKRIAKSIWFDFGGTDFLRFHLGMTGYFVLSDNAPEGLKHAHLQLQMHSGRVLTFCDPRRFGQIAITTWPAVRVIEPFAGELTPNYFGAACKNRMCCIKSLIMDQQTLAGLGNIHASEALFIAGIRPDRIASSLKPSEIKKLCKACIEVIAAAVKAGIDSLDTACRIDDETVHFPISTQVYGRENELCTQCRKHRIEMLRISGRSSYFCPVCQK
jgi:formamidopyrimidine-DNA glycosylase